jgi:hypothetical protein
MVWELWKSRVTELAVTSPYCVVHFGSSLWLDPAVTLQGAVVHFGAGAEVRRAGSR